MLDNRYCILFIRGTRPVMDRKVRANGASRHPLYDGLAGGPPYIHHGHGQSTRHSGQKPLFQTDFDNENKENAAA